MLASIRYARRPVLLGRTLSLACRRRAFSDRNHLIDELLHNPELDAEDVCNELRWMRQAIPPSLGAAEAESALDDMVRRRSEGEPLQYILGKLPKRAFKLTTGNTDFGELTLLTRPPVLIPRPETAHIVEDIAARITVAKSHGEVPKLNVLDLCTGSGCIPLLLSHLLGDALGRVYGVDISPDAIALARDNIRKVNDPRVKVVQADIFMPDFLHRLREHTANTPFHIIVSNPPYISKDEYTQLPRSVREYEDSSALLAGPVDGVGDGVAFYAHIACLAPQILAPVQLDPGIPRIAVEIGASQGHAVASLLPGRKTVVKDQFGIDRMVLSML